MRQRRLEIELLKFIAAISVVILHVFEPGGRLSENSDNPI